MKRDIKYHADKSNKYSVFCGNTEIARSYVGSKGYEVRILQGMPRDETIKKICTDCPEFAKNNGIDENYYPYLF
jgi:hypothetical protein